MRNEKDTNEYKSHLILVVATLLFGLVVVFKELVYDVPILLVLLGRFAIAFIAVLVYVIFRTSRAVNCSTTSGKWEVLKATMKLKSDDRKILNHKVLVSLAGVFFAIHGLFYVWSINVLGGVVTTVWAYLFVQITTIIWDAIIEKKFRNREFRLRSLLCLLIVLFALILSSYPLNYGVFVIVGKITTNSGFLFAMLTGIFYGLRISLNRHITSSKISDNKNCGLYYSKRQEIVLLYELIVILTLTGFVVFLVTVIPSEPIRNSFLPSMGSLRQNTSVLWLFPLGLIATAIPFIMQVKGLSLSKSSSTASMILILQVVWGVVFLHLLGIRPSEPSQYIGVALIILAVAVKAGFERDVWKYLKLIVESAKKRFTKAKGDKE